MKQKFILSFIAVIFYSASFAQNINYPIDVTQKGDIVTFSFSVNKAIKSTYYVEFFNGSKWIFAGECNGNKKHKNYSIEVDLNSFFLVGNFTHARIKQIDRCGNTSFSHLLILKN